MQYAVIYAVWTYIKSMKASSFILFYLLTFWDIIPGELIKSMLPIILSAWGLPHIATVSSCGSCQVLPENCHWIIWKLAALHMGTSAASCWGEEKSVSHSPPPSHVFPDGPGSQTGNLAVTNPPHEPSGHSCPPCWVVISSCGKLDASEHKVYSRCLKCHNTTMQVVDWQRGRFRFLATASEHLLSSLPHEKGGTFHLPLFTREACICAHILFISSYFNT